MPSHHSRAGRAGRLAKLTIPLLLAAAAPAAAAATAWVPDGTTLTAFDLTTGTEVESVTLEYGLLPDDVTWSATGELLATSGGELVAIDPGTGAVETLTVLDLGDELLMGLAEDACGRLFVSLIALDPNRLEIQRLDPTTGATETVVTLEPQLTGPLAARGRYLYVLYGSETHGLVVLQIDPDSGATFEHTVAPFSVGLGLLDFDPDGNLWHAARPPVVLPPPPPPVVRIDLATGAVAEFPGVYLAPGAITPAGGACGGVSALPIPAASPVGLAALALLLAAAGTAALARGRQ